MAKQILDPLAGKAVATGLPPTESGSAEAEFVADIVANLKDVVFRTDAEGFWTYLNPAWTEVTGYTVGESLGTLYLDYIHPEDHERTLRLSQPLLYRETDYCRYEIRYRTREGGFRWVEACARLALDSRGNMIGTYGTLSDITEHIAAREAISESRVQLEAANSFRQHITDTAPFLIYVFDVVKGQMTYMNEHVRNLLGYTPEDVYAIRGQLIETLAHPDDRPRMWEHLAQVARRRPEDGYVQIEYRMRHTNGEWRWFRSRDTVFRRSETGVVLEALGVAEDITEARAAAAALRQSQERYEVAVHGSTDCIWDCDLITGETFESDRWAEIFGYEPHEMPKNIKEWIAILHPEDVAQVQATRNAYLRGETNVYHCEYRGRCKDGSYRWVLARGSALRTPEGVPYRLAGSLTDISERRAAAERERLLTEELQRSNRELNDFASVVSHDLQEPLRKISMFGDLLRNDRGSTLSSESQQYMASIGKATVRMQSLIRDLLAFSRLSSKPRAPVEIDLNRLVSDVSADLEARIASTGGQIQICGKLPTLLADPLQMRQLFQNLLGNALKFQRPGVPPVVTLCSGLEVSEKGRTVGITVSDNGIGFGQEYASQIFGVFERLHAAGKYEGTGMGLAICRKIVERHGGTICAKSTPGNGATFTITLPADAARTATERNLSEE